ncbi:MAG: hypothetical protein H6815_08775 [Phycisphaeraceae bacterium]|nr:hypothetical protein [Phycisphaerales bacterium]MCB9860536.1 hypothetical protein [Phycisphaeraceae bacterium]
MSYRQQEAADLKQLRIMMDNVQKHFGSVSPTARLLLASLAVIVIMGLFLVRQYSSKPTYVPLFPTTQDAATIDQVSGFLESSNIPHEIKGSELLVPADDRRYVLSKLGEQQLLPADTSILFTNLLDKQTMWQTSQQHRQASNIALMNELSRWITQWDNVEKANVFIDVPDRQSLGDPRTRGTASVTVKTRSGTLSQSTVDAIASFVAGSKAGLNPEDVRVIDARTSRQYSARSEDDAIAGTYLEHQTKIENQVREKLLDLLAFVPGVTVAVSAQVDVTRSTTEQRSYSPSGEGTVSLKQKTSTDSQSSSSSRPRTGTGLTANVSDDPTLGSGSSGSSTEGAVDEKTYENQFGYTHTSSIDPGGRATRLVASINVPRGWYATIAPGVTRDEDFDPTAPDVITQVEQAFATALKPEIESLILPHLTIVDGTSGASSEGIVSVSLIPIDTVPEVMGSGASDQAAGVTGMVSTLASRGMIEKAVLGVLAVVSLFMMVGMVKKAGKRVELPPIEELVGIPPSLLAESDLVGEAGESDGVLEAVEVADDEFESTRMLEQIRELVKNQPDDVSNVIRRWVNEDRLT